MLVENEIQPRHVDTLGLSVREVHIDLHLGLDLAHGTTVAHLERLMDLRHADPVERACGLVQLPAGDVGHIAHELQFPMAKSRNTVMSSPTFLAII